MAAAHCSLLLLLLLLHLRKAVARLPCPRPSLCSALLPELLPSRPVLYVEVDDVRLFYHFIQSERNPEEDPVLLWLTGEPGCPVYEIVPHVAGYTEGFPRLVYFQDSCTKVGNVIFLIFLRKWLADHTEFASNPLYIGGDSYSGYTVPDTALDMV